MCSGRPGALSNAMPMLFLGLWRVFILFKWRRLFCCWASVYLWCASEGPDFSRVCHVIRIQTSTRRFFPTQVQSGKLVTDGGSHHVYTIRDAIAFIRDQRLIRWGRYISHATFETEIANWADVTFWSRGTESSLLIHYKTICVYCIRADQI